MHYPCSRQLASRVHSIRHAECALAVRGFGNKSQWTREAEIYRRSAPEKGRRMQSLRERHCGSESSAAGETCVYIRYPAVIRLPAAARCTLFTSRQIPLDMILSLWYTLSRRYPTGIRDTLSRDASLLRLSQNVRKTVPETITYRIAVFAVLSWATWQFKSFGRAEKTKKTLLIQIGTVTATLFYASRLQICSIHSRRNKLL